MREPGIGIFPVSSWLRYQFLRGVSKSIWLLSQSNLVVAAAGLVGETNQPVIFTGNSRRHGKNVLEFDFLLLRIGERKTFRHVVINRSVESDLGVVRKFVIAAVVEEQTVGDAR